MYLAYHLRCLKHSHTLAVQSIEAGSCMALNDYVSTIIPSSISEHLGCTYPTSGLGLSFRHIGRYPFASSLQEGWGTL